MGELHKEWTEAGVSASRVTSSDIFRKRATKPLLNRNIVRSILPGLRRKRTGLLLSGPKFQMKVDFAFNLEIKVPESGGRVERYRIHVAWSPVWSFHCQWWFGLPCICWCWSIVFSEVHSQRRHLPGHFKALHASFCWQALWRCWFHFPAGLGTCPLCWRYQKLVQWPECYCAWLASKLAWPEPHRESRWETPDPTMQMTWRPLSKQPGLHYTWAVPRADRLHATLHWCSNSCKRRPNQVLSA